MIDLLRGVLGLVVLLAVAYGLSSNRKAISWQLVGSGLAIQLILALLILKVPFVRQMFDAIAGVFVSILRFAEAGSIFMFGNIIKDLNTFGYIFAFQVLPTVVFFSAVSAILYYLGILQKIIFGFAWLMSRTMRLSGAESLAAAANVFIGQTEAPLVIKPYLDKMTRSEMLCLMTGGMATIAGGVFAAYVGYLGGTDPEQQQIFATHLLTASIMSAPAAIMVAKMLYPEDRPDEINTNLEVPKDKIGANLLDAISIGTTDGLRLAINVGVMLLVFTALVQMCNEILMGTVGEWTGLNEYVIRATNGRFEGFSFTYLLGLLFAPVAWIIGVETQDIVLIGQLLGQKTVINEFIAYAELGAMRQNPDIILQPKSIIIATYALCGFANFASIGIQIGGIGALAPNQRRVLSEFGIKALIGGTIACLLTGVFAGVLVAEPKLKSIAQAPTVEILDIDQLAFQGGSDFQTPLNRFLSTMGSPDSVATATDHARCRYVVEQDTNAVVYFYGTNIFYVSNGWVEAQYLHFQDSTQNIALQSPTFTFDKNVNFETFQAAFPNACKEAIEKDGFTEVKLFPKPKYDSHFLIRFKQSQLFDFRQIAVCH